MILITGGTGYVGGRLIPELESRGLPLRCMARQPEHLRPRVASTTEVVQADLFEAASLEGLFDGVQCAYYLVHALGVGKGFEERERTAARNFVAAAKSAGVERIVYLGGLGGRDSLSAHLATRQETGEILSASGIPTIEFRASIIIGSGSLSFALIRALVDKLPVMVTPRWVRTRAQPISIEDVLSYLVLALDLPARESVVYEIGGSERVSYLDLMRSYARQRGLKRLFLPVPFLTPSLSSLWLGLVTPVYARVGRKLIEGVRNETIADDAAALRDFPIRPRGVDEAVERALRNEDQRVARTRWSDALSASGVEERFGGVRFGSRLVDSRVMDLACTPAEAFTPVRRIGGKRGWYSWNFLWRLRGWLDLLVGGVGLRRGRRDAENLRVGDTLDFWRVEEIEPDRLLRLVAEMRLPGRAWLQFEVEPTPTGARLRQTAIFDPKGLSGLAYWYLLYPLHRLVFGGMLRSMAKSAILTSIKSGQERGTR